MNGFLHTRYPCEKCVHHADHEWLLRDLRSAIFEARLRGMSSTNVPTIYVDCEGRYSPLSRVLPRWHAQ